MALLIPEAHARGCDPLTVACHVALDHNWRVPQGREVERLHLMVHGADPIWWALPDFPFVRVVRQP